MASRANNVMDTLHGALLRASAESKLLNLAVMQRQLRLTLSAAFPRSAEHRVNYECQCRRVTRAFAA
eukprot:6175722-Pleurochrysis_carterae.AAC.2